MSEADEDAVAGREIWIEKYRPQRLSEIHGQEDIVERLQSYIEQDDLPHLLFAGPAGTGKCVVGETPVLTSNGLEPIECVVGDVDGFAEPDGDLRLPSLTTANEFEYRRPSHVYSKPTNELQRIETRDGNDVLVTPEHKLLIADEEGLDWIRAENLEAGDRIARPESVPVPEDSRIDWISEMNPERTRVSLAAEFADHHDLGKDDVPLGRIRELNVDRSELREGIEQIRYVNRFGHASRPITPLWEVTSQLARFIGLAVSEASIEGGRVKFYNTDQTLLDVFADGLTELFGLEPEHGTKKDVPYIEARSRTLTHFLESTFDVFASASGDDVDAIGSTIITADEASRTAFLRSMFDAEGYVSQSGIIELTQRNEHHITLLSYLLTSLGIPSRRKREMKKATNGAGIEREYQTLLVSGASALRRFRDRIGFSIEHKAETLADHAAKKSNPNYDTVPAQQTARDLCHRLHLPVSELFTKSLNPETPSREAHLTDLDAVIDAAVARIESTQEALERLNSFRSSISAITRVPATWVDSRGRLDPIETRNELEAATGVRSDRLLEYSDGRRSPTGNRAGSLLSELDEIEQSPAVSGVQKSLKECVNDLGIDYATVAEGTELRGTEVIALLENDDHDIRTLTRFETIADRLRALAADMLSQDVIELLRQVERVVESDLYFDEVTTVSRVEEQRRVYDLSVPGSRNYVAGQVPTVMHNTTSATAIAREIYGEDWRGNFLELNASDERGIDVVRDRIKSFARASFGGYDYRIIFLDEADSLCVPPGTEVVTGYPSSPKVKPIEEISDDGEPIPSVDFGTNEIQSDKGKLVDSGVADFFEVELEDGRTVLASLTHPFFTVDEDGRLLEKELRELSPGDEIADFKTEVGVSRCEICDAWTAGRFCSVDCKNEGHSQEMRGEGNPMYGTEWSDERREKIVEKLSDGRFEGENNPNYGGEFHGVHVWEMDEETVERVRETISEMRSGTAWEEWVVDADPKTVKKKIGNATSEWWDNLDNDEKARLIEKSVENCEYPVCDISGDDNPMRDPEVAKKVSKALKGHEPTGGNVRHSEELGHLVRSDWEYEVAKALQDAGIEYEYEPAFELSESVYHPDFLIDDTVIEVKGVADLWGQTEKVEEFLETYGDEYTFVVVGDGALPHHEHYERDAFEPALVSDGGPRTVQTVGIRRIEYSHRGKAYNISMEGTPNFMLANGILTHNTDDAQSALRRTMEQFSDNTRFILSCNYSSKIIDPIQSRCAVFRFSPLDDEAIASQVEEIAETEGIELTDDGREALVYAAAGDMRRAINSLQAAATTGEVVDEEAVYRITATARPEEIEEMVDRAIAGDFTAARSTLDRLLTDTGMAGGDVIDQLHRSVWEFDLSERDAVRLMERIGETDYRISEGANERVQLEALLASLALDD